MFDTFSHYVSYGATDQQTIRDLASAIDGLVVPGTVAAFQRQGTGGFVLTLSATTEGPDYVIDPRFPLFQQPLRSPKASHLELAELFGVPELVTESQPSPGALSPQRVESIASGWVEFNAAYQTATSAKFEKYARRLNEEVDLPRAKAPLYVLAPYLVASAVDDPWWNASRALFDATRNLAHNTLRVVAASDARSLAALLTTVEDDRLVVWVSGLEELEFDPAILATYASAIRDAGARGTGVFALYGGFFSVLLAGEGLRGSSHGIGYGEYRHWIELPQSGPPPARYYMPILHRYVSQEFAYEFWLMNPEVATCNCPECAGAPPIALEYHGLMKHSVHCRATEIVEWRDLDLVAKAVRLEREHEVFVQTLVSPTVSVVVRAQGERVASHMPRWAQALRLLAG
jgi:hypothetical protein